MPLCDNPLWPCAMTGAVSCLVGFEDLAVVIHGSSGCYFYPASLLQTTIYGTHLLETDVIFGSEHRLQEVIGEIGDGYRAVAVVTTCVPSLVGEDIRAILAGVADVVVDAPGFLGGFEEGYRAALHALGSHTDSGQKGVNIEGLNPIDPYYRGNIREALRLFALSGLPYATLFCADRYDALSRSAPLSLTTNPDLALSEHKGTGDLLGLEETKAAFETIRGHYPEIDIDPVCRELQQAEERLVRACDKYLRRHDPPSVLIFGGASYAILAATILDRYLDSEIIAIGSRNREIPAPYLITRMNTFREIRERIAAEKPDLILGSSYEESVKGNAAFVPFTFPLRGRVTLRARTLVGPEGVLALMEDILNACLNKKDRNGIDRDLTQQPWSNQLLLRK